MKIRNFFIVFLLFLISCESDIRTTSDCLGCATYCINKYTISEIQLALFNFENKNDFFNNYVSDKFPKSALSANDSCKVKNLGIIVLAKGDMVLEGDPTYSNMIENPNSTTFECKYFINKIKTIDFIVQNIQNGNNLNKHMTCYKATNNRFEYSFSQCRADFLVGADIGITPIYFTFSYVLENPINTIFTLNITDNFGNKFCANSFPIFLYN